MFTTIGKRTLDECVPVGSRPLQIFGTGTVRMCVGEFVDYYGKSHPIDIELTDVHWVPLCPMNILSTVKLQQQNIYLFTGGRGNELYMPGFSWMGEMPSLDQNPRADS